MSQVYHEDRLQHMVGRTVASVQHDGTGLQITFEDGSSSYVESFGEVVVASGEATTITYVYFTETP